MTWKVDLRMHETGALTERLLTSNAQDAEHHFRRLLAREDLVGSPIAARIISPYTGKSIYFSKFDRSIGKGRIHAAAPLDLHRLDDGTWEATAWMPD